MAIVVETLVRRASKDDADLFDSRIEEELAKSGGPPVGLMVHIARPAGDGFLICDVWRTEGEMKSFYDEVVLPALAQAGLEPNEPLVEPVWSFARP